jgi:ATP diphosphatase
MDILEILIEADKVLAAAEESGFSWPNSESARAKFLEEITELDEALQSNNETHIHEEFGDALFSLLSWGRTFGGDGAQALQSATLKFSHRLQALHDTLAQDGLTLQDASRQQIRTAWEDLKSREAHHKTLK